MFKYKFLTFGMAGVLAFSQPIMASSIVYAEDLTTLKVDDVQSSVGDIPIEQKILKISETHRPGKKMTPKYITVHNTANSNRGADAEMHSTYLQTGKTYQKYLSWHYTVDNKKIIQHIPIDEIAYHAGDGEGDGNNASVAIEICENKDGNYHDAEQNAEALIANLLYELDLPVSRVVPHKHWSGKYCPHNLLSKTDGSVGWDKFISEIQTRLDNLKANNGNQTNKDDSSDKGSSDNNSSSNNTNTTSPDSTDTAGTDTTKLPSKEELLKTLQADGVTPSYKEEEKEEDGQIADTNIKTKTYSYTLHLSLQDTLNPTVKDAKGEVSANHDYKLLVGTYDTTGESTMEELTKMASNSATPKPEDYANLKATSTPKSEEFDVKTDSSGKFSKDYTRTVTWTVTSKTCSNYDELSSDEKAKVDEMIKNGELLKADDIAKQRTQISAFGVAMIKLPSVNYSLKDTATNKQIALGVGSKDISFADSNNTSDTFNPENPKGETEGGNATIPNSSANGATSAVNGATNINSATTDADVQNNPDKALYGPGTVGGSGGASGSTETEKSTGAADAGVSTGVATQLVGILATVSGIGVTGFTIKKIKHKEE